MKKIDLTQGKVIKVLTLLALPVMGSSLLQFTYSLIDMLWVGALGSDAVASIGSSSFFTGLGYAINSLVVIGTGIKVAHALGRGNEDEAKDYINTGLFINGVIGILFALLLIFGGKSLIGFLDLNNPVVERDSYIYLLVNAPNMFFTFYNFLFTRIFGSYGNNSDALKITSIGLVTNIILDPILIYVVDLGVAGAALATLVANIIMFILFRIKAKGLLKYDFKRGLDKAKANEILRLGFPMAIQRVLFTMVNIILAKIIAVYGSDAIAAQKIGLQIESVGFMIIGGLNGAIMSFTGQNFGAKKYRRIKEGYATALKIGFVYSSLMALGFIFFGRPIVQLFIREEATVLISISYLQIVAISQVFSMIEMVSNGLYTGLGMPKIPAIISIIFTILRIPMAIVFTEFMGLDGIWLSVSISSILKGITAYIIYIVKVRKRYDNVEIN